MSEVPGLVKDKAEKQGFGPQDRRRQRRRGVGRGES